MKLMRPTKEMMLAVNATIDGDNSQADSLIRQHQLNRKELGFRLEKRGGEKYTFDRKRRGGRKSTKTAVGTTKTAPTSDITMMIDGRTKTSTLVQIECRVQDILAQRNGRDVTRIRDAVKQVHQLRAKLKEAESLLGLGQ